MLEGDGDPVDCVTARSRRPLLSIDRRVTLVPTCTPNNCLNPEFEYENLAESAQETINERHQEAQTEGHRSAWLEPLAVSTALFAVLAAFASLKAGDSANEALYRANQAVLQQTQAVDTWSQFQADSSM